MSTKRPVLNIVGSFFSCSGTGVHARKFAEALARIWPVRLFPTEKIPSKLPSFFPKSIAKNLIQTHTLPVDGQILYILSPAYFNRHLPVPPNSIAFPVFESTALPSQMINCLQKFNAVWVPSTWGKSILKQNGISQAQIKVVPEGIDPTLYFPTDTPLHPSPFRFLMIGKTETRKGLSALVQAFESCFLNQPHIELYLALGRENDTDHTIHQRLKILGVPALSPSIKLVKPIQNDSDLGHLYRQMHAFVLPTHAEGWGLPILEALACGLPVITTRYGAPLDYLHNLNMPLLDVTTLTPVNCPLYYPPSRPPIGNWADYSVKQLGTLLKQMVDQYPRFSGLGQRASKIVRTKWTWEQAAQKAVDILAKENALLGR